MPDIKDDLPPEIRDRQDMIEDGMTDELQVWEELAAEAERRQAKGRPKPRPGDAEPVPETA